LWWSAIIDLSRGKTTRNLRRGAAAHGFCRHFRHAQACAVATTTSGLSGDGGEVLRYVGDVQAYIQRSQDVANMSRGNRARMQRRCYKETAIVEFRLSLAIEQRRFLSGSSISNPIHVCEYIKSARSMYSAYVIHQIVRSLHATFLPPTHEVRRCCRISNRKCTM